MAARATCPRCGHENEADQRFCGACGSRLALVCGTCGEPSALDSRFCGACGAPLATEAVLPAGEERRVVTVLFVDLVGFTSRAERMDPEDVRAVLTPYYKRVRTEIEAFGGVVEKFIGDAVMGVFGAPVAHGDDPERAVRAALRVQEAVEELNRSDPALDLRVRIAVNTGEAIVSLGARPSEGEAMVAGDVVNTAARLQSAAEANTILVGEETYRCTRTVIRYRALEPVVAKGKEAPVPAWQALDSTAAPGERPGRGAPFVGRDRELGALIGIWDRVAQDRHPHLVTVFGPPGVGKTRLGLEFGAAVEGRGGSIVRGRSLPYGEQGAYGAFAQQVKQIAGIFDTDPADLAWVKLHRRAEELVGAAEGPRMASHVGMLLGMGRDGTADNRHTLFFSARRLVEALAADRPTLFVFEDLHWADPSLLDLLEFLASRTRDAPLLFLALARPDLLIARQHWGAGVPAYTSLPLEPLGPEQSRELAAQLLVRTAAGREDVARGLAETGEGNPLFIEELAASLSERTAPTLRELPTSIRGIVAARLDALPAAERSLLLDASVMGRIFWDGALARLGAHGQHLPELLDSLEGRDLIRREAVSRLEGQEQFRFKHVLIRDVAYATLPRARRRAAHAVVAAFLEEVTSEGQSPAALAHHWREAGQTDRAVACFVTAAEQARRGWAKEEALRLYGEALRLVPEEDRERRRAIRLQMAVTQQMVFHLQDAENLARRAAEPDRT